MDLRKEIQVALNSCEPNNNRVGKIEAIVQIFADLHHSIQLIQPAVVGQSEQFYCNTNDGEYNNNPCSEQCVFCKEAESLQ